MNKKFSIKSCVKLGLSVLTIAILNACGGDGSSSNTNTLSLTIEAPNQYPAGLSVPVDTQLTITNTSKINATNLVYTIPAPNEDGNSTGVTITPNPGECTNIKAGASCTFSATIAANAKPGTFTVTATSGSTNQSIKQTTTNKQFNATSVAVNTKLALVDVPSTNNEYYILPSDQTIQGSTTSSTSAYVSVWVKAVSNGISKFNLVDQSGESLEYSVIGNESFTVNSINTYKVNIPAGKTLQHIQVLSNVCNTLNDGTNNDSACSNDADINLIEQGLGILSVQPNYFNMSESNSQQIITVINSGSAKIESVVMPSLANTPFSVSNNTCSNTLAAGKSCSFTLNYQAPTNSDSGSFVISYYNGKANVNIAANIPYQGTSANAVGLLTLSPTSLSLSANQSSQTIAVTNTGTAPITNLTLPDLPTPLETDNSGTCTNGSSLAVGSSCTYTIKYTASALTSGTSAGNAAVYFYYNNGAVESTNTKLAVDWASIAAPTPIGILDTNDGTTSISLDDNNLSKIITLTNKGTATITDLSLPTLSSPLEYESNSVNACQANQSLAPNASCTYKIKYSSSTAGTQNISFAYNNGSSNTDLALTVNWIALTTSYVAVGSDGTITTSIDGINWTKTSCSSCGSFVSLLYDGTKYVSLNSVGPMATIFTSSDLTNWNTSYTSNDSSVTGLTYANSKYLVVGGQLGVASAARVLVSTDLSTWTNYNPSNAPFTLRATTYGNGKYIVVGDLGKILVSSDAQTWSTNKNTANGATTKNLNGIVYANNKFVVVGNDGTIISSSDDGETWSTNLIDSTVTISTFSGVTYGNGTFVAVGSSRTIVFSTNNGVTWTKATIGDDVMPSHYGLNAVSYGKGKFIAVGMNGITVTSTDGQNWSKANSSNTTTLKSVVIKSN
ncbi:MAG: Endo,4-beta-xylanase precursor [Pseudomonadota bacterium]|jgi:photosystem II stability/assembly factor-like uncharacterized protein